MFLMNKSFCSFKFTLFVLIYLNIVALFSHGSTSKVEKKNFHILHLHSPVFNHNCSAHKTGKVAHRMELRYAYGPCSPFPKSVQVPSGDEMLLRNERRVRRINGRKPNSQSYSTMDESDGKSTATSLGENEGYTTTIGLGRPKFDSIVVIDTGSDPSWVRCTPCLEGCTTTSGHLYDPLKSETYRNDSTEFSQTYGDHTSASGIWSYDRLTLGPNQVIDGFKFGCGHKYVGGPDDFSQAAGMLGLGRGDSSLVSQSTEFGKVFGYCLPKLPNSNGYLLFGDEARRRISSSTLQFTQLLNDPPTLPENNLQHSLYFLKLVGISVAGNQLNVLPEVFTSVGTIIDSGTVVSHLPREAYAALSSAFKHFMLGYQPAQPQPVLDTCFFVNSDQSMNIPTVTFHFDGGTDVELDKSGIGWTKGNIWCLGFTAKENERDLTIIGSIQQREMEILYDIDGGKIGFRKTTCGD